MVSETGLYETLGVSPDSEATVIKKAYKQLALKYHPDKNPSTHAEERFKGLQKFLESYLILIIEEFKSFQA